MSTFPAQYFGSATSIVNQTNVGPNTLSAQIGSGGGGGGGAIPVIVATFYDPTTFYSPSVLYPSLNPLPPFTATYTPAVDGKFVINANAVFLRDGGTPTLWYFVINGGPTASVVPIASSRISTYDPYVTQGNCTALGTLTATAGQEATINLSFAPVAFSGDEGIILASWNVIFYPS